MQNFPHHYQVSATALTDGDVELNSEGLVQIKSAPPKEFGGMGDKWSPETLLVSSIADCFILSFRAIANASKLSWNSLNCQVEGVLDKSDGVIKFTSFSVNAQLILPDESNTEKADKLLDKAKKLCLITNSLSAPTYLEKRITY